MALWDKDHGDQNMFRLDPGRKQWLQGKVTMLQEIVQPDQLWPHLIALGVLDNGKKGAIKLNHTDEQQVEGLCHHLQKSPVWAWHAFLRSLVLTHQEAVVNTLGIDPKSYKDAAPVVGPPPSVMPLPPWLSNTAPVVAPPATVMSPPSGLSAKKQASNILEHDDVESILAKHKTTLFSRLEVNHLLKAALVKYEVINPGIENKLDGAKTDHDAINILVDAVRKGGLDAFLNFCRVLCMKEIKQGYIVKEVFGLNIADIEMQREMLK